jgi:hypothetical protein
MAEIRRRFHNVLADTSLASVARRAVRNGSPDPDGSRCPKSQDCPKESDEYRSAMRGV